MSSVPFYSQNQGRRYPLVDVGSGANMLFSGGGELVLPDEAIVDITVIIGLGGEFDVSIHRVYLAEVRRTGDELAFVFRFDAPHLTDRELVFCRRLTDDEFATSYAAASSGGSSSLPGMLCDGVVTEGWLTTGQLTNLGNLLSDGQWLRRADGQVYVEPARIQVMDGHFVRTINTANADRTRAIYADCLPGSEYASEGSSEAAADRPYHVNALCLQGNVRFRAGFNCEITQDTLNNQITIGAGVGAGLGEPCEEIPLYDGEIPHDGGTLLSGGPACSEIIKAINGLPGPNVNFIGGRGIRVEPDETNPHKLIIRVDFHGIAVCSPE